MDDRPEEGNVNHCLARTDREIGVKEMAITIDEVKSFLTENATDETVKGFVSELSKPSFESVSAFIETEEGKKLMQPMFDRRVTQGIDSYKQNHGAKTQTEINEMLKAKEEEVRNKYAPKETPEQIKIRELEERLNNSEFQKTQAELKNNLVSALTDNGLSKELAGYVSVQNVDEIPAKISELKSIIDNQVKLGIESKLSGSRVKPGNSNIPANKGSIETLEAEYKQLASKKGDPFAGARMIALQRDIQELKQKGE